MAGKINILAHVLKETAVIRALEALPRRKQLVVLNYHRIGDYSATKFDAGVFSATQEILSEQVAFVKKEYDLLTPAEALDVARGRTTLDTTSVLFTFDDGYLDNLELATPALAAHGAEAIFFLVTSYLDAPHQTPWWDVIAWMCRQACPRDGGPVRLDLGEVGGGAFAIELTPETLDRGIAQALAKFKDGATDQAAFFAALERETGVSRAEAASDERLLMDWDDARAMQAAGMTLGLHTHTHEILGKISVDRQAEELRDCWTRYREVMGEDTPYFAYPVGCRCCFGEETKRLAREVGFEAAFSFYGGANSPGAIDPFDIRRVSFPTDAPEARSRAALAAMALTGSVWI